MNEEELFCKLFPEYVVNGKPLSPYFDLFESGYEQAEKRIEELEKDKTYTEGQLDEQIQATLKLQKENAELKLKLEALEGQTPWKDIKDKSELIKEIADLEKENAELKKLFADCDTCKRTCDIGNCCKFGSDYLPDVEKVLNEQKQLTKAKEIIKYLLSFIQKENYKTRWDINITAAEQFLKSEVEK